MRNGTQEELDAARKDATLLPFDALYMVSDKSKDYGDGGKCCGQIEFVEVGAVVVRSEGLDDSRSVGFLPVSNGKILNVLGVAHMDASDLEPIK